MSQYRIIQKAGHNDYFAKTANIIDFDITNEKERKNAYYKRNVEDRERWVIAEIDGEKILINIEQLTKQSEQNVYHNSLECPYCLAKMILCGGNTQKLHVRHKKGLGAPDCPFMTTVEIKNKNKYSNIAESPEHKAAKKRLIKMLLGTMFPYPIGYKIDVDKKTGETRWITENIEKKIVEIKSEVRVLKKNNQTKGYQPDLLLIFEDGSMMALEVTASNGKTVKEYSKIWARWNHPVVEIRLYGEFAFDFDAEEKNIIQMYAPFDDEAEKKRKRIEIESIKINKREKEAEKETDKIIRKNLISDICYDYLQLLRSAGVVEERF